MKRDILRSLIGEDHEMNGVAALIAAQGLKKRKGERDTEVVKRVVRTYVIHMLRQAATWSGLRWECCGSEVMASFCPRCKKCEAEAEPTTPQDHGF